MFKISENFVPDKNTNWNEISTYYQLSEEFIEKYIDKLYLSKISRYQNLSEDFIEKHFDKLYLYGLKLNDNISRKTKRKFGIINFTKTKRLFFRKKYLKI